LLVAQVVPDLATFAVDDGFAYAVAPGMAVAVGSIVRVPLGNRRVRGYVVGLRDGDGDGLKEIAAVSGNMSIFDKPLLETLRWAALHYVAPLSVLLAKTRPPNLPRQEAAGGPWTDVAASPSGPLAASIGDGTRIRPAFLVGAAPWAGSVADVVAAAASRQRSSMVVVPTVAEGEIVYLHLKAEFGDRVVAAWSAMAAAQLTAAWATAASAPGTVAVGTRDVVWWRCNDLGTAIVLGEGRRGMKEPQTPTTHVRDVLRRRGAVERFPVVSLGAVPTTETVAAGVEIIARPGRSWPLTEIVDRSEEPPGSGVLTERARAALRTVGGGQGSAFVLCRSRGEAVRCVRCRALRLCTACGTSLGRAERCPRCESAGGGCSSCGSDRFAAASASVARVLEEVSGIVGDKAAAAGSGAAISVGTERDIPGAAAVDIAIAVDGDGAVFAANYRAAEEALSLLARLAQAVRRGRGNRAIVQTSRPDHAVYEALRSGNALGFLADELESRRADAFPPIGELIAIEVQNALPATHADLAAATSGHATLLGPADLGDRQRWLIQGGDLRRIKVALRGVVQSWREGRARVRIDVDPIDL
jgi:primosomal protein N'